jgi:hypothetical protein
MVLLATVAICTVRAQEEEDVIKTNATGSCSVHNSNCDWFVGVWNVRYYYSSYSCNGNGYSTYPLQRSEVCCTEPYSVPAVCVNGYREDDGVLVSNCILQQSRFNNHTSGDPDQRTIAINWISVPLSFEGGLNYNQSSVDGTLCSPFRQLTTDSMVGSANSPDITGPGIPHCPDFPVGETLCDTDSDGLTNSYFRGRRRIPASRGDGYQITKNMNTKGLCSLHNTNCDWFTGAWDGYIVGQGFSYLALRGEQDVIFPYQSASDIRCASEPYIVPYSCDNGYSVFTGELVSYCIWGVTRIIPANASLAEKNGGFFSQEFSQYNTIPSLENGVRFVNPGVDVFGCAPMDRIDIDTIISNVVPAFPALDCTTENISPDVNVRCVEDGANSINIAYAVLVRSYGSGGPAASAAIANSFSSGSALSVSFATLGLLCLARLFF